MNLEWGQPGLLVASIPLLSGIGALTAGLGRAVDNRFRSAAVVLPACGASLVAALAACISIEYGPAAAIFPIGEWLPWHSGDDISVGGSLQWDAVSSMWVIVVTGAALLLSLGHWQAGLSDDQVKTAVPWMLASLCAAQLLVLSGDFIHLVALWLLTLLAVWQLTNVVSRAGLARDGSRRTLSHIAAAGLPLLLILSFVPSNFGSFQFAVVLEAAATLGNQPPVQGAIAVISFGVVFAVLIRCAQFPFCNWLLDLAVQSPLASAWTATVAIVPTGVYLLIRVSPLLQVAPAVQSLLFGIGCPSMLLCAFLALTRSTTAGAIAAFLSGTLSLACIGIATVGGAESASFLAASAFLGGAALFVVMGAFDSSRPPVDGEERAAAASEERRVSPAVWGFLLTVGLASGMLGQEAVLQQIWDADPQRPDDVADAGTLDPSATPLASALPPLLPLIAPVVVIFSQLLLSLALFRRLFVEQSPEFSPPPGESEGRTGPLVAATGLSMTRSLFVTGIGLCGSPMLLMFLRSGSDGIGGLDMSVLATLAVPGIVALLTAISLLLAWIIYQPGSNWPSRLQHSLSRIRGLTERRFYLDELADFLVTTPLMLWSKTAQLIDNSMLRYGLMGNSDQQAGPSQPTAAAPIRLNAIVLAFLLISAVILVLLQEG